MSRMTKLERAKRDCRAHLWDISRIFVRGAKLTLIVRIPGEDEADLLLTDDNLDEVMALIERSKAREESAVPA